MHAVQADPKTCLKCGYLRRPSDSGPEEACPSCGAVYSKVEAALRNARAGASGTEGRPTVYMPPKPGSTSAFAPEYVDADRRRTTHLVYFMYLLPIGVSALMGYSIVQSMKDDFRDEIAAAHNEWQFDTLSKLIWMIAAAVIAGLVLAAAQGGYWVTHDESLHHFTQKGGEILLVIAGALYAWILLRTLRGWWQLARGEGP